MSNILEVLKENQSKSDFIRLSLNQSFRNELESRTSFLNKYYKKIPLKTRAYVILNGIVEENIPKCICGCGNVSAINVTYADQGFRKYSNSTCSRKSKTISDDAKSKLENYEWVYTQRILDKKSIEKIASDLNISTIPVVKYLKIHNLNDTFDGRRRNSRASKILSNKKELQNLYDKGITCEEIAKELGVTKSTVSRWLGVHNIETRNPNFYERKIKKISREESNVYEFIQDIYKGTIIQSNRSILNGKELDIYIPDKNLAIEYNGLYSHLYRPFEENESLIKDKLYHLNKTLKCKERGIQLIQIYSDEWNLKPKIVKSLLSSKLGLNQKIYARKCEIANIDTHTKNTVLNDYHLQGEDKSLVKLGLIYKDDLVCVMTFCKSRFNKNYEWELSRFASKMNINVIGGFSKLLKYFIDNYSDDIVSYADRRYSEGNVYFKNNFSIIRINSPSYYYVDKNCKERINRMKFQKKIIGAIDCTEYEKALEMGYNKIYDCGTICFGYNKKGRISPPNYST